MIDIVPTILEATGIPAPVDGQWHRAEADRRREHGLHVGQGERRRPVHAHDAVLRDVRQPRDLSRRLDRLHDAAAAAVADGPGQDARRGQRLQMGALQHHGGFLAGQRPRRPRCPTSCARCRSCSWSRRRSTRCSRWTTTSSRASSTPRPSAPPGGRSSPTAGEMSGIPNSDAPNILAKSYTITADVEVPAGGGDGMIVHRRRPLRRLRPVPAQGQAGVHLQPAGSGALPLGRAGRARTRQAHDRLRLQIRRPRLRQGRHGRADASTARKSRIRRSRTRSRSS